MALSVDMVERSGMLQSEPVVPNVAHIPESVQREQLKRMFHFGDGDTLAFADADQRRSLEALVDRSADPEHTRKRIALAYYYSAKSRDDIGFTYDHIDQVIRTFSGGEEKSVEDAYKDLAELYGNREPDNAVWAALKAGGIGAGKLWLRGAAFMNKVLAEGMAYQVRANAMANGMTAEEADRIFTDPKEVGKDVSKPALNYYKSKTQQTEQNAIRDMNISEDWVTNSDGILDWFRNAGLSTLSSLPQLGAQIVWTAATGPIGAFELYAADAYYNIEEAMPDASKEKKLAYAGSVGLIVSLSEKVTFGLIKGKPVKDVVQYSLGRMFAEAGIDLLKEVGSEGVEQLGTNAADILSGMRGDTKGWTTERYMKELFKDVPESGITAAAPGYGLGLFGRNDTRKNYLKKAQAREHIIQTVEERKKELEAKEDLSDGERVELQTLNTVLDSGKLQDIDRQMEKIAVQETVKQLASSDKTEYAEDATDQEIQDSERALELELLTDRLPHNPEDTEFALKQQSEQYGVPIQTTREWTDDQVRQQIDRLDPDLPADKRAAEIQSIKNYTEALWNPDGTITVNTAVVRPSRVPFVVAHELLVHEGLARVFGEDAKNQLLDAVWKDYNKTELMYKIQSRYNLLPWKTAEDGTMEAGELTEQQKREAAEEFLAHLGETNGVPLETIYTQNQGEIDAWARSKKLQGSREHLTREWMYETGYRPERPGWLRQLISAIRVWLRQHGFTKLVSTLSDQDIQYILAKAAKADLSKRRARNGEAARLAIFGEEGARRMENAVQLLENLSTAKQMTADGKDAKAIKLATGWELGGDGKWRMEMPDAVFTTRAKLPDGAEYDRTLWDVVNTTNGKLSEYVVADEIFEAYPELKDYHFQIGQMPSGVGGSFNPDTKTIYINQLGLTAALKMVDDAQARLSDETLTAAERKSAQHRVDLWTEQIFFKINETLVHEVQHAIQRIEGFAPGSNVRHFIDHPEYDPKRLEKVTYYREKLEKAQKNLEKYPELKKMVDRYVELEDVLFSDDNVQVDEAAIDAEMDQIKAHFESIGKRELFMDYITGRDNYTMAKDAAEKHKQDPVESYRRTAGEVEARNVQERMDMTMEERLNSLLSETEDVAEKDKIYLNGLVRGNSNSESGMRDAELEILQAFPKHKSFQAKEILKSIADKDLKNIETGIDAKINTTQYNKMTSNAAVNKSLRNGFSRDDHFEALANIEVLYQNAVLLEHTEDLKNNDSNVKIYRFASPFVIKNDICDVLLTVKETISSNQRRVYTLELTEIKKLSERGSTKPNSQYYTDSLHKLHQKHEKIKRFLNKTSEKINGGTDGYGDDNSRFSISPEADVTETAPFKNWFGDSKVVDENGKPLEVYHGTNWDMLQEAPGDAVFSDKHRGTGSGDNGFFGRGFYFTFGNGKASEGEAGYYGKNVYRFYLSIQNPFYFSESLLRWNGKRVFGDEVNSVEIINAVKLFPELLKDYTLDTYDSNGDHAGTITLEEYADLFMRTYNDQKFSVRKTSDPNEIVVESDPVEHEEDGHRWTDYGFSRRMYKPGNDTDIQLLSTHLYLQNGVQIGGRKVHIDIPNRLLREFYGEPEFRSWLEAKGYDGVMQSKDGDEVVAFEPNQIKSASDNVGTFDPGNLDVRFSISEEVIERQRRLVDIIKPYLSGSFDPEFDYAKLLMEKTTLTGISFNDAKIAASIAFSERKADAQRAAREKAYAYFRSNNPLFEFIDDFAGGFHDFHIVPVNGKGEKFTGTFISPEYVKWSEKRPQGKNESDKQYQNYLQKREEALKRAKGYDSADLAEAYARKTGLDTVTVEQEIVELFRDLKKPDILSAWKSYKDENLAFTKAEMEEAQRIWEDQEQARIEDEVIELLSSGEGVVSAEWVMDHRDVYNALYRQLFNKAAPYKPSTADLEAINGAIVQEAGNAAAYAQAFKDARKIANEEARQKVAEFRRQLEQNAREKINATKEKLKENHQQALDLQRKANAFVQEHLNKEDRTIFNSRFVELLKIATPEKRMEAFDRLQRDVLSFARSKKHADLLEKIHARLDQLGRKVDAGRKAKGVRHEEEQTLLDRIRAVSIMGSAEIAAESNNLQGQKDAALDAGESTEALDEQLSYLSKYGNLFNKSVEELTEVLHDIELYAKTGRNRLKEEIEKRAAEDARRINRLEREINNGEPMTQAKQESLAHKRRNKTATRRRLEDSYWQSLNLWGLFNTFNLTHDKDLRSSQFYEYAQLTHRCAQEKDSRNRHNMEDFQQAFDRIFHIQGSIARGDKILELRKIDIHSGVHRQYLIMTGTQFDMSQKLSIKEARQLLSAYDAAIKMGQHSSLKDYEAEAIRHQLRTIDSKAKMKKEEFFDGVTDKLVDLFNEENQISDPKEKPEDVKKIVVPKPNYAEGTHEIELTQLEGLNYYLLWQQKDIRYKLQFNGITEETVKQLERYLLPETKELGKWMVEQLKQEGQDIDAVWRDLYFTKFPQEDQYFPTTYPSKSGIDRTKVDITEPGSGIKPVAYNPGALRMRVFHTSEPTKTDALTIFQNHRLRMSHFITHARAARELRAAFMNPRIRQAIKDYYGPQAFSELQVSIRDFINGGNIDADRNALFQRMFSTSVRIKMALNITSGVKQIFGALSYLAEIPPKKFINGVRYACAHPKEVWQTLGDTEYFRNRWNSGGNIELRSLLDDSGQNAGKMSVIMEKWDTLSSLPLRLGDAGAILFGGYAVYKHHYDEGIRSGLDTKSAKEKALLEWEMATERTQQSSQVHMQNKTQRKSDFGKVYTVFISNQILWWNQFAPRFIHKDWSASSKSVTALLLVSAVMTAVGEMLKHGTDFDEWELRKFLTSVLSDGLCGYSPASRAVVRAVEASADYYQRNDMTVDDLADILNATFNIPEHIEEQDFDKILQDAQYILAGLGLIHDSGALASSALREGRKWWKIFGGEDKNKKKKKKTDEKRAGMLLR